MRPAAVLRRPVRALRPRHQGRPGHRRRRPGAPRGRVGDPGLYAVEQQRGVGLRRASTPARAPRSARRWCSPRWPCGTCRLSLLLAAGRGGCGLAARLPGAALLELLARTALPPSPGGPPSGPSECTAYPMMPPARPPISSVAPAMAPTTGRPRVRRYRSARRGSTGGGGSGGRWRSRSVLGHGLRVTGRPVLNLWPGDEQVVNVSTGRSQERHRYCRQGVGHGPDPTRRHPPARARRRRRGEHRRAGLDGAALRGLGGARRAHRLEGGRRRQGPQARRRRARHDAARTSTASRCCAGCAPPSPTSRSSSSPPATPSRTGSPG